ncbi:hypothetical protein [Tomitella gaofuii]|uniref:hypothetical protein n=1 Tax=Tomitella gaofuii TaxID=2760083 RepID=UPI0015FA5145|nr:hypothetical protein [Tomitella gaofuii]
MSAPARSAAPTSISGPIVVGSNVVVQADCGEDGVAGVHINFGKVDDEYLVGRNSVTQSVGGTKTFSRNYGLSSSDTERVPLTVTTRPTRGTCTTTITDYDTGEVAGQKETAGRAQLSVVLSN